MKINRRLLLAGAGALCGLPRGTLAQSGSGNIRLVVGFPPGGSGDVFARITSNGLAEQLNRTVIVDNRAGAGGLTAAEYVIRAPTDGSTLILHTGSSAITSPISKLVPPYNPVTDFAWIAHLSTAPFVIAINPNIPATDLRTFIAYAKSRKGDLTYGSAGVGTTIHLAAEVFDDLAGFKATHVPYRGSAPAIIDVMSGSVAFVLETVGTLLPYHRAGTLRILAIFADQRAGIAPEIPTARESGIDLVSGTPNLLAAPPKTPPPIIDRLAAAIRNVMARKALQEQLLKQGIQPITDSGPDAAKAYVAAEIARLTPVVQRLGIAT